MAETIRFAKVVEKAGQPEPYTLWQDPGKDKPFQTALKEHRVLTVQQTTVGSKADYGEVGYVKGWPKRDPHLPEITEGVRRQKDRRDQIRPSQRSPCAGSRGRDSKIAAQGQAKAPKVEKMIQFPKVAEPAPPEKPKTAAGSSEPAEELKAVKQQVRKAMEALSKDQHVAAYKILDKLVKG